MPDQDITCTDCQTVFTFTEGEQEFYSSRNLNSPQRCKACRDKRKSERLSTRQMYDAVCADCGKECQVPFKPRAAEDGGRPVLCKECFFKKRDGDRPRAA